MTPAERKSVAGLEAAAFAGGKAHAQAEIDRLRDDLGAALVREDNLREALVQIETVCKDNAVVGNTALALKFVREIAERGHQQKGK